MAFSQSELYTLAKQEGLSDSRARVAAAIGMAESGGDPNAHNAKPPDDSWGLWQINMRGALGPQRRAQLNLGSDSELLNPKTNARAMAKISSNGGNFNAWSTYTTTDPTKSYRRFMTNPVEDQSNNPNWADRLGNLVDPFGVQRGLLGTPDAIKSLGRLTEILGRAAVWTSDSRNWIRIGYVATGAIIFTAGLVMIVGNTKAGQAVTKLTPAGRVRSTIRSVK